MPKNSDDEALTMMKRTLYECSHARVSDRRIYCDKGHPLSSKSDNGGLDIRRLASGSPLALRICQNCLDFDCMGPPIPEEERGWAKPTKKAGKRSVRNSRGRKGKVEKHGQLTGKTI